MAKKKVEEFTIEEKLQNALIPEKDQPYKIPQNWCWVNWSSAGNLIAGNGFPNKYQGFKDYEIPFYKVGSLKLSDRQGYIFDDTNTINNDIFKILKCSLIPVNSILFAKIGEAIKLNRRSINNKPCCIDNNMMAFIPKCCLFKYAYYWTTTIDLYKYAKATIVPALRKIELDFIPFPLPPLAEQERIVNKLDNYISKLNEAKEKLEKVVDTYEFRKYVILYKAFKGELTKNWRKENPNIESVDILLEKINQEKQNLTKKRQIRKDKDFIDEETPYKIPNTWKWIKLKNICTKIVDGSHNPPKGESEKTDYIMLSATNIKDDKFIDLEKVRYLSKENFDLENQRTNIQIGDICFTSVGSIGRSCIFKGGLNICFQRSVSIITTPISSEYLKYFFDSSYFQNKVQFEARGSCQVGFYLNQLAISLIPLPPLEEQKEIVKILDSILTKEKQVKEIAEKEIERVEDLKKNLLTRAFGGVLGTNDPNEENSIELLKSVL